MVGTGQGTRDSNVTDDLDKPADEIGSYQKGPFEPEPYDGRKQEDDARRNIAYALIGLLFLQLLQHS